MNMFDSNFDPLATLQQLQTDQQQLYINQQQLNQNLKIVAEKLNEQQAQINTLLAAINAANKTNEMILEKLFVELGKPL